MRDGLRYALLMAAGLIAVLFIIAFTAWGLTTYGSIRHVVGVMADQPDRAADLHDQYQDMVTTFAADNGNAYTFHFRSAPITIMQAQVAGMDEAGVISLVLDTYTSGLYDNSLTTGGLGAAGVFVGSTGNLLYALTAFIFAIAFILFIAGAVRGFAGLPGPYKLKSAGKTIAAFCAVVFVLFALLPGILESLLWGSVANNSTARDALDILGPLVVGSLLRNVLLVIVIGGIMYVAGYYLGSKGIARAPVKAIHAPAHKEHEPENHKRRSL